MARREKSPAVALDTHVVAWLHDGLVNLLSRPARTAIEGTRLLVSPVVELELAYLHERGRFRPTATKALELLAEEIGLARSDVALRDTVREAVRQSWTRDPFDRLIVGEAIAAGVPLVTRDELILEHFPDAIW